jgi:cytochrome c oxidase assembly protein subunit 11
MGAASRSTKNRRVALSTLGAVVAMVGLSFASVPLYDLFCRVTGFGGTTQQASTGSTVVLDREITVRFDASINKGLPWSFRAAQPQTVKVGETNLAFYKSESLSDRATRGTASFNVTPLKAGEYFVKIDCFCFTDQTLGPGQAVDMPVTFYVDPAIADDPDLDDTNTITLSYTFFPKAIEEGEQQVSSLDSASANE